MPSYLIVHSEPPGGRADLFSQPPTIDVSGLGARLDWGDVTFQVSPGDHRVEITVAHVDGRQEGAVVTVRVLPETGTRVSFAPPVRPGMAWSLRIDGQWPADAAMAYYAAKDRLELVRAGQPPRQVGSRPTAQPVSGQQPGPFPQQPAARSTPMPPAPSVPPVGPAIGSTGSVPVVGSSSNAPTFGQVQGAVVEPGAQQPQAQQSSMQQQIPGPPQQQAPVRRAQPPAQHGPQQQPLAPQPPQRHAAPPAFGPGAQQQVPAWHGGQGQQQPGFGQQIAVRRDVYGRDRVDGDRSAPAIPTPHEYESFARAERERREAEVVSAMRMQQGWHPDPYGRSDARWHDGEQWTPSVLRQGRREHDPV